MKDDPCGLQNDDHKIAARFHRVLISARDALDADVKIVAEGAIHIDLQTLTTRTGLRAPPRSRTTTRGKTSSRRGATLWD